MLPAANLEKAAADRQAQLVYDTGLNEDALRYNQLVKEYTDDYNAAMAAARNAYTQGLLAAEKDYASAANAAYSAPRTAAKQSVGYSAPQTVTGYRIGNDSTVYTTGAQLLQALKDMGFTQTQAIEYAKKNGISVEE